MRLNDALFGFAFIALAIAMITVASGFPAFPGQPYGAALFPTVIACGFIIAGAVLVFRGVKAARGGERVVEIDPLLHVPRNVISLLLVLGCIVAYIQLADWIGFIPIAFAILFGLSLWFGTRLLTSAVFAAVFTWATFWFFASMLRVPLPRGLLTNIL